MKKYTDNVMDSKEYKSKKVSDKNKKRGNKKKR